MRVLLVDHDVQARANIHRAVKTSCSVVEHVKTGEEALQLAQRHSYAAIILDLILPDMDGYEVIKHLRGNAVAVPILVLSSLNLPQAKIKAFSLGADDFITRPFDQSKLGARIQALVRRSKALSHSKIVIGSIVLDMDTNIVTVNGIAVFLTEKQYTILQFLFLQRGAVVSRQSVLNHIYGGDSQPGINIISVFMFGLRHKLSLAGAVDVITTVSSRGYTVSEPAAASHALLGFDEIGNNICRMKFQRPHEPRRSIVDRLIARN